MPSQRPQGARRHLLDRHVKSPSSLVIRVFFFFVNFITIVFYNRSRLVEYPICGSINLLTVSIVGFPSGTSPRSVGYRVPTYTPSKTVISSGSTDNDMPCSRTAKSNFGRSWIFGIRSSKFSKIAFSAFSTA